MAIKISPQPGPQTDFLKCNTDICIFGGAASGGKSYGLILAALYHIHKADHRAVCFRRTSPMLRATGSILQDMLQLYPLLGAKYNDSRMSFSFPSGASIQCSHLQSERHMYAWQGSQISTLLMDELSHFTSAQVSYLLSRLRNPSIKPVARFTTNPEPSFVRNMVAPWLDSNGEFPDYDKSGKILYVGFGDNAENPIFAKSPCKESPLSITFIPSKIEDNQILLSKDPEYRQRLQSLPLVERERLLNGNWAITHSAGSVFKKHWFQESPTFPTGRAILAFDLASTLTGDNSSATLMVRNGFNYYIIRNWADKIDASRVYSWITLVENEAKSICQPRGCFLKAVVEEEGGSAAKRENETLKRLFTIPVSFIRPSTSKIVRSRGLSAAAEQGKVFIYTGGNMKSWIEPLLDELQLFPNMGKHDDRVDATTYAFNDLSSNIF